MELPNKTYITSRHTNTQAHVTVLKSQ